MSEPSTSDQNTLVKCMRPRSLGEIVGLDQVVASVEEQFRTNRVPHFYLICGSTGTGKTTLSRIIANMIHGGAGAQDTQEINASDKNGIDDIRALIDAARYRPVNSAAKVIILDECHQLTTAAQNALLKITEDTPNYLYFIFSTSNASKIIDALKRRAYIINTRGLTSDETHQILARASAIRDNQDFSELKEELVHLGVSSPGLVLQAAEKYFSGYDVTECVMTGYSAHIDTRALCQSITSESWEHTAGFLVTVKKEDVPMLKVCISAHLKNLMLRTRGDKAVGLAEAIKCVNENYDDVPCFCANVALAKRHLKI